jgi:hypothetical protein
VAGRRRGGEALQCGAEAILLREGRRGAGVDAGDRRIGPGAPGEARAQELSVQPVHQIAVPCPLHRGEVLELVVVEVELVVEDRAPVGVRQQADLPGRVVRHHSRPAEDGERRRVPKEVRIGRNLARVAEPPAECRLEVRVQDGAVEVAEDPARIALVVGVARVAGRLGADPGEGDVPRAPPPVERGDVTVHLLQVGAEAGHEPRRSVDALRERADLVAELDAAHRRVAAERAHPRRHERASVGGGIAEGRVHVAALVGIAVLEVVQEPDAEPVGVGRVQEGAHPPLQVGARLRQRPHPGGEVHVPVPLLADARHVAADLGLRLRQEVDDAGVRPGRHHGGGRRLRKWGGRRVTCAASPRQGDGEPFDDRSEHRGCVHPNSLRTVEMPALVPVGIVPVGETRSSRHPSRPP